MKRFVKSIVAVATIISIVLSLMPAALASSVTREDDKTVVQLDSGEVRIIYDDGGLTVVDKNGRTKAYESSLAEVYDFNISKDNPLPKLYCICNDCDVTIEHDENGVIIVTLSDWDKDTESIDCEILLRKDFSGKYPMQGVPIKFIIPDGIFETYTDKWGNAEYNTNSIDKENNGSIQTEDEKTTEDNTSTIDATAMPSPTITPSATEAPTPTKTPTATTAPSPTKTPVATTTPSTTTTPSPTKTPTATTTPSPTKTPSATEEPTVEKTPKPTKTPITTPKPTKVPAATETPNTSVNDGDDADIRENSIFKDVPVSHWANENINRITEMGAFSGYEDGTFHPDNQITHEEFLKVVMALIYDDEFDAMPENYVYLADNDTSSSSYWTNRWAAWAQPYLTAALDIGIVIDDDIDLSVAETPITRGEMAKIISRAVAYLGENEVSNGSELSSSISDWNTIPSEYKNYIAQAYSKGILAGYNDGSFGS